MLEKIYYEMPQKKEGVIEVVMAIPSSWSWVDGFLMAPKELYEQDQIALNTGLAVSRFYSIRPTIIGRDDVPYEDSLVRRKTKKDLNPSIIDIAVRRKLFSSVSFDEAAFQDHPLSMSALKKLILGLIGLGYKGWIQAYSDHKNNSKYDNPETLSFQHFGQGSSFINPAELPPHILLTWEEKHGGKRENLDEIIRVLERLELKKIQPQEKSESTLRS
jgi:hypothetical protein